MSGRKSLAVILGFILSVSLLSSALTVLFVSRHYSRLSYELADGICRELMEQEPDAKDSILAALKEYTEQGGGTGGEGDLLSSFGYRASDFAGTSYSLYIWFATAGALGGILLFVVTFCYRNRRESLRISALTEYLEQAHIGKAPILSASGEDAFAKLEDEIYKTVTFLYQTRDAAVEAKNEFAKNLSHIAHQIKTPITAILLSAQLLEQDFKREHLEQIEKQLLRLTRLEEALLLLSRLDAGALPLERREVDVFTMLVLAGDNLRELFSGSGTCLDIPELGEMAVTADLEWTMEAVMNLMKNCMEHDLGGTVHCSYGRNPLYTEVRIWDEGEGFAREDLPHLFERFYRGRHAAEGGIGIGLALAKEIIERQNGTLRAENRPEGGACFEIRFYPLLTRVGTVTEL